MQNSGVLFFHSKNSITSPTKTTTTVQNSGLFPFQSENSKTQNHHHHHHYNNDNNIAGFN
jgi:hypothetical protein